MNNWTPCLRDRRTGETIKTIYEKAAKSELKGLRKVGWNFDWLKAEKDSVVYKLKIIGQDAIQGLLSVIDEKNDQAIFVKLIESSPSNIGRNGKYEGVGPHLMAIAAKESFSKGYDGYVFFDAKSSLISHYEKSLGAKRLGSSQRMVIETSAAKKLVGYYFGKE